MKQVSVCSDADGLWIREINPNNFVLSLLNIIVEDTQYKLSIKCQSNGMPLRLHSDTAANAFPAAGGS